ncbi:polysaccharide biosynthesis protein [Bacillus shivajii]|uniref:putative polysaccharide biosynthesis protein n=1 Tax=Bacillus shivajii TaxID=1983719 RepID=UPI001CF93910|nr:polysaccharide biosynthesis protein [Bacillus shivajii]UCZ53314.1 polysaccharide biosynthesis protein [Bacillus shivajii]
MKQSNSWMKGALYLSLAAFIAKGLSALYKVPYQNLTGDLGFYVYQQVYPIYGVAFILGSYGIPVVVARMIAEVEMNESSKGETSGRLITLFIFLLFIYSTIGSSLLLYSEHLANMMGDNELKTAIKWLGLPFFILPFLAVGRGYFQGRNNMLPTAVSQVGEQFVRVIVIICIAAVVMQSSGDPYMAGISAGAGAFIGGLAGVFILGHYGNHTISFKDLIKNRPRLFYHQWKSDLRVLIISGFFLSLSAMAFVIYQLVDAFMIYRILLQSGVHETTAATLKGIYDRSWPLVQFGAVVTTVFSYAALPYVTKAHMKNDRTAIQHFVGQSLKVCFVFGGAAAAGLVTIMPSVNSMLFTNNEGQGALQLLAVTILFGSLFMTCAALLHAVYEPSVAAIVLAVGIFIKMVGNVVLIPHFDIYGAATASSISFIMISTYLLAFMKRRGVFRGFKQEFWKKWAIAIGTMMVVVFVIQLVVEFILITYLQIPMRIAYTFNALFSSGVGAVLFLIIIWRNCIFEQDEWESLPKLPRLLPYKKRIQE